MTINSKTGRIVGRSGSTVRTFNQQAPNTGSRVGNIIRRVFSNSNSISNNNDNTQNRVFEPSRTTSSPGSGSTSSGSSSGGNAPVRSFR